MIFLFLLVPIVIGILFKSEGLVLVLLIAGMVYACMSDSSRREEICVVKVVSTIGGCNRSGFCRVSNSDGTEGFTSFPLVGKDAKECCVKVKPIWWDDRTFDGCK